MTNFSATPPGWYQADGDPAGTQRYWDGSQWVGEPQAVAQQPSPGFAGAPSYNAPAAGAAGYGTPGGPSGYGAPAGYVPFAYGTPTGAAAMVPAPIGKRIVAYFIDISPFIVVCAIAILGAVALGDVAGPLIIVAAIACAIYGIWNFWVRRGRTGQSIGDSNQGIKLVKNDTGQPAGGWLVFARYFVITLISNFTCGIVGLLDILWPLWDDRNNRLGDKMFSMTVVVV